MPVPSLCPRGATCNNHKRGHDPSSPKHRLARHAHLTPIHPQLNALSMRGCSGRGGWERERGAASSRPPPSLAQGNGWCQAVATVKRKSRLRPPPFPTSTGRRRAGRCNRATIHLQSLRTCASSQRGRSHGQRGDGRLTGGSAFGHWATRCICRLGVELYHTGTGRAHGCCPPRTAARSRHAAARKSA